MQQVDIPSSNCSSPTKCSIPFNVRRRRRLPATNETRPIHLIKSATFSAAWKKRAHRPSASLEFQRHNHTQIRCSVSWERRSCGDVLLIPERTGRPARVCGINCSCPVKPFKTHWETHDIGPFRVDEPTPSLEEIHKSSTTRCNLHAHHIQFFRHQRERPVQFVSGEISCNSSLLHLTGNTYTFVYLSTSMTSTSHI